MKTTRPIGAFVAILAPSSDFAGAASAEVPGLGHNAPALHHGSRIIARRTRE